MKTITSEHIVDGIELSAGPTHYFGGLEVVTTDVAVQLTDDHANQMAAAIRHGLTCFDAEDDVPEATLAHKLTGLPTMLARIDCSIVHGIVQTYEVEERPNGMGITTMLGGTMLNMNTVVQQHFMRLVGAVPTVMATQERIDRIDDTFADVRPLVPGPHDGSPVLLRAEPKDLNEGHDEIISASVSTARSEGSKGYRERTGHAQRVSSIDVLEKEDGSMVIKALQCSKAQHVDIVLSAEDKALHGKRGTVTKSRALRNAEHAIQRDGSVIVERFIPPIAASIGDTRGNMILRVFAAVTDVERIAILGGVHVTRPELVVHGARNAINGLVMSPR